MSNHHEDRRWESEMSRGLDARASNLDDAPFSLEQVKGRATRIRRRRRLASAGAVLAVAAVLVPVGVLAGQGPGEDPDLPPASRSSDPTVVPTTGSDAGGTGLGADYVEGRTWVRSDGAPVRLPAAYDAGVRLGDLLVGVRNDDDTGIDTLDLVDGDGDVTESLRGVVAGPVVNVEGTAIAYVTTAGEVVVRAAEEGEGRTVARGLGASVQPAALVGVCDADDSGCRLYVSHGDGTSPPQVVGADGSVREVVEDGSAPLALRDANADAVAALLSSEGGTGCSTLYDAGSLDPLFDTCTYALLDLAPTGQDLAVTHADGDGEGHAWVAILDEDRQEVARLEPDDGTVRDEVWAEDGALLVTAYERVQRTWTLWRLVPGSEPERVAARGGAAEDAPTYRLVG
ncbi:hypothetical protein [Nocardioides lijunqiniae]|uniref:hypothetical protein n=1 Tax=Nocardioides lijunqiniae TaxID=2760832 RepID=UPI001878671A|nr:hypothetical protein [Nocardioides lijunqiniae]